jgi:hypothetical protein
MFNLLPSACRLGKEPQREVLAEADLEVGVPHELVCLLPFNNGNMYRRRTIDNAQLGVVLRELRNGVFGIVGPNHSFSNQR